jgi:putative integral membrane protein (TIGR02587 family)
MGCPTPQKSLKQYARGVGGGLMISLPLLYTMEMWWTGFISKPGRLLAMMGGTFLILLAYNRFAGLRSNQSFQGIVMDAIEELGLGLLAGAAFLTLLSEVDWNQSLSQNAGKIVVEGLLVAIGISVGGHQLGSKTDDCGMDGEEECPHDWFGLMTLAVCGAVLFGANVAPTDEIPELARKMSNAQVLGLAVCSLTVGAVVLFFSEFSGEDKHASPYPRTALNIALVTTTTYAVALSMSLALLWFFNRVDGCTLEFLVKQTVVLGFPAMLGASAGRMLLQ